MTQFEETCQICANGSIPERSQAPATVLLVEDDDAVSGLLRRVLQREGYRLLEARNSTQALTLCAEHPGPIDLLLTDAVMAPLTGRELVERVATLRPGTRVLCISGYPKDDLIADGKIGASIEFLQKPFTPVVLARRVRDLLEG